MLEVCQISDHQKKDVVDLSCLKIVAGIHDFIRFLGPGRFSGVKNTVKLLCHESTEEKYIVSIIQREI